VRLDVQSDADDQVGVMFEFLFKSEAHAGILSERG
jgi:hypothetical protein